MIARAEIAKRWQIPPPDVEHYPNHEIETELRLMQIEARARYSKGQ